MELHRGRLIDHVHLRAKDLAASKRFYAAIFDALGIPYVQDDTHLQADEFWMDAGDGSKVHLAFQAKDRDMVDKVYAAALAAGGRDNGAPGLRPQYHPHYYGAFVLDPDGHNIEAVCHEADPVQS